MQYKNQLEEDKYNFNVISNEALFLGNSSVIKLLIALLKDISSQKDDINRVFIKYEFETYIKDSGDNLHNIFSDKDLLIEEYDKIKPSLLALSYYEIIEKLIVVFSLNNKKENFIYLQAFNDLLKDFSNKNNLNISNFLEWWDEKGYLSSVSVNENQDAAQILTIHKSKGLEFKIVIIPFADWKLNRSQEIIWTENLKIEPFNKLNILPIRYTDKLKKSVFYKEYYNELLQQYVDNLNLTYVAFTRAKNAMYIFSRASSGENSKKKDLKLNNIGDLLSQIIKEKLEENIFIFGEFQQNKEKYQETESYKLEEYLADKNVQNINIKYQSNNFFSKEAKEKINRGLLYHKIFENIIKVSDIEKSVQTLINEGKISQNEKDSFVLEIKNIIKNLKVEHWFDGTYKVKNEISILYKNKVKRPDRLMFSESEVIIVDYKFGEKEHLSYVKQVDEYKKSIELMGFKNIKSYIWYVNKNKITKI
jgi:ATP-dependent exoDNAse (exonuclease V) beta subunit